MSDLPTKDLSKPRNALIIGFVIILISTITIIRRMVMLGEDIEGATAYDNYYIIMIWTWFIGFLTFHIALGMLAKRIGQSAIIWAGLSVLTSPLGPFAAFPWMLVNVSDANKRAKRAAASDGD